MALANQPQAKSFLTHANLEGIKDIIQLELLKRGVIAPIVKIEEVVHRSGSHGIELLTEYFQTVPVMFKKVRVTSFNTNVEIGKLSHLNPELPKNMDDDYVAVWINTHFSYEVFDGGSNGTNLISFWFNVFGKEKDGVRLKQMC